MHYILKSITIFVIGLFTTTHLTAQTINDEQTKLNIAPINNPVDKLIQLNPVTYEYNTGEFKFLNFQSGKQYGFLSENIATVFPELVSEKRVPYMIGKNNYRNAKISKINETSLIPVLVASIAEQQKQIEQLRQEIELLKKRL